MNTKILILILVFLIVGTGTFFLVQKYFNDSAKTEKKTLIDDLQNTQENTNSLQNNYTDKKIIYLTENDGVKEIISNNVLGTEAKILFTDRDEDLKFSQVGNVAYLSREAIVYVSTSTLSGKFYIITLNESGKKDIIDNIANTNTFAISPDGQKVGYVFDKAVYLMNRNGENKRLLFSSEDSISAIAFNNSASDIIVSKTNTSGKSKISKIDLNEANEKEIYSSEQNIPTLSWQEEGVIVATEAFDKFTSSRMIVMDSNGNGSRMVLETKNGVASYGAISENEKIIAYLAASYSGEFASNISGDVKLALLGSDTIVKISMGNQVLGWLP